MSLVVCLILGVEVRLVEVDRGITLFFVVCVINYFKFSWFEIVVLFFCRGLSLGLGVVEGFGCVVLGL